MTTTGHIWVELVGDLVIARVRGEPTEALLQELQEKVLFLAQDAGRAKVLYDTLEMEPPPLDVPWAQRALDEKKPWASLEALRALIEACPKDQAAALSPHLCEQITTPGIEQMSEAQQLAALPLTRSIFARLGPVSADEKAQMLDMWSHFPEPLTGRAKAEVTRLLAFIEKAPTR